MKTEVSFYGTGGRNLEWAADKWFGRIRVAIKPGLTADVIVTHAVAESAEGSIIQAEKINAYVRKLEAATNPADLGGDLGGDLNSHPHQPAYSVISSMFTDIGGVTGSREATYGRPGNTYNHLQSTYVQSTLDYIFVRYQEHVLIRANQSVNEFK